MGVDWSKYLAWRQEHVPTGSVDSKAPSAAEINFHSPLDGSTILMHAVKSGNSKDVELLLSQGASVVIETDHMGLNAAAHALLEGDKKMIKALLCNEHEIQASSLARLPPSIEQAAKFYDHGKTGLLETEESITWEPLASSTTSEALSTPISDKPNDPPPPLHVTEQPSPFQVNLETKPASSLQLHDSPLPPPDEDLFYSAGLEESENSHIESLAKSSLTNPTSSLENSTLDESHPHESTSSTTDTRSNDLMPSSVRGWFAELMGRAKREDASGDLAREQLRQLSEQVKNLEKEFKEESQRMLAERDEKLDIVLMKLEQMGRELESFRIHSAKTSPRVESLQHTLPGGIKIANDGGLIADARRFAPPSHSNTTDYEFAPPVSPLPHVLTFDPPPPPPPLPPMDAPLPPPPPPPTSLPRKIPVSKPLKPSQPPKEPKEGRSSPPEHPQSQPQKKAMSMSELKGILYQHFENEIKDQTKLKAFTDKWVSFFETKSTLKILEIVVKDYPFLIGPFWSKPQEIDFRVRYWEEKLFEKLEEKERQHWIKQKNIIIQKKATPEEIDAEITLTRKLMEEQRRKEQEKLEKEANKKVLGDVMTQLKEKLKDRQEAESDNVDEAMKALDDLLG